MYIPDKNGLPLNGTFTEAYKEAFAYRTEELREQLRDRSTEELIQIAGALHTLKSHDVTGPLLTSYNEHHENNIAFLSGYVKELIKQKNK